MLQVYRFQNVSSSDRADIVPRFVSKSYHCVVYYYVLSSHLCCFAKLAIVHTAKNRKFAAQQFHFDLNDHKPELGAILGITNNQEIITSLVFACHPEKYYVPSFVAMHFWTFCHRLICLLMFPLESVSYITVVRHWEIAPGVIPIDSTKCTNEFSTATFSSSERWCCATTLLAPTAITHNAIPQWTGQVNSWTISMLFNFPADIVLIFLVCVFLCIRT